MTAFRIFVCLFAAVPLFFGVTGVLGGAEGLVCGEGPGNCIDGLGGNALDNQFRYLSGVYIGISAMLFYVAGDVKRRATLYRAVVVAVFIGGIARAVSYLSVGAPPPEMIAGMIAELSVPITLLWLNRVVAQ